MSRSPVWERSENCEKRPSVSSGLSVRQPACNNSAPLDGIQWINNVLFENLVDNSSFIKIRQEKRVVHRKTSVHFWSYLAHFFLEWEMFQTKAVEKIKTHILCSVTFFFPKIVPFVIKCGKILYSGAGHRWQYGARALHAGYPKLQTYTHRICNTYCFSTVTMVTRLDVACLVQYNYSELVHSGSGYLIDKLFVAEHISRFI